MVLSGYVSLEIRRFVALIQERDNEVISPNYAGCLKCFSLQIEKITRQIMSATLEYRRY